MLDELERLREEANRELAASTNLEKLEQWKARFLGKSGAVTLLLRGLGQLPPEQRPVMGREANLIRAELENRAGAREEILKKESILKALEAERIDVTLPGRPVSVGRLHPVTRVMRDITNIFALMGFQVVEGPEVELDRYNFELLNMPPDHPARDMWDTFYITDEMLLRTHTSPVQVRVMERLHPNPVRAIMPGRCYRYEAVSARSEFMFHQVEGLAVGKNVTMADLKGVLISFAQEMFGQDRKTRFRCSYFPFTEPSAEMDIDCIVCSGEGCRICKQTGWLEILGAGMVHPTVLSNGGYDPSVFSGFAFGMGPERIAMLKYGIDDIRLFYGNDLRFLKQFD